MDLGLKGKNAIVLGGTRGIGRAIAATLAGEGGNVAVCARNADQVAATVTELKAQRREGHRRTGRRHRRRGAEIMDRGRGKGARRHRHAVLQCRRDGARPRSRIVGAEFPARRARRRHAFDAARPFLEASGDKSGDAAFVIISSISAAQADTASSYGPIKAALIHMAKGLARQYAKKKIRVNVVSPGTVYFKGGVWNMIEQNMPKRYKDAMKRNPTGPHGNAAGDRNRRGVSGKPGVGVHHRLQSRRGRRDLEPGEFLRRAHCRRPA